MTSHESMSIMVRVKAGELTVDQAVELVRRIEGQKVIASPPSVVLRS